MNAILRFLKTTLILAVLVVAGAIAYAYSGWYDVSVGTGHNAITHWYLETVRDRSIERRAAEIEVPSLNGAEMMQSGARAYNQGCAGCHGRPGRDPRDTWDPPPPPLTRMNNDPAETFWVVRNGIKMSAMPAIAEDRINDEMVWAIAAFLADAPRLTEGEYRELVEPPPEPEPEPEPEAEAESTGENADAGNDAGSEEGGDDAPENEEQDDAGNGDA